MAHGSTQLPWQAAPGVQLGWLASLRRGAVFGVVLALHLGLLALLFGPVTPRWPSREQRSDVDAALEVRLLTEVVRPPAKDSITRPPARPTQPPRRVSVSTTVAAHSSAEPAPTMTLAEPRTLLGDYHSPLLSGRDGNGSAPSRRHLPGSDAARVRGITLDTKPSMQQVVRAMTKANRCKYVSMAMARRANQFITGQLMNRALEADGCGPQVPHTGHDETVEAISHQAIFGG